MRTIVHASTPAELEQAAALLREYADSPDYDATFAESLAIQDFARELAELPGAYAPPAGRLLLALVDGEPAGCAALKALDAVDVCEMKRLYVRPAFRSLGVGRALVEALLAEARAAGYRAMRLDTLPEMRAAQRLYRSLGFYEIPPYSEQSVAGALFFERRLDAPPG
jgi:ribosomal protein S18 acetylase RimI-like enzyme